MTQGNPPDDGPLLTPEEVGYLRTLFDGSQEGQSSGPPQIPVDPQALDVQGPLLRYLMDLGDLTLIGEKGRCRLEFPIKLELDDAQVPALRIQAPSLVERHQHGARNLRVNPAPGERFALADLDGRFTLPRILNVSVTGLFIADAFSEPPAVGEMLEQILLTLPSRETMTLKAEVVRVSPLEDVTPPEDTPGLNERPQPTHAIALRLMEGPQALEAYVFHRFWQLGGQAKTDDPFGGQ